MTFLIMSALAPSPVLYLGMHFFLPLGPSADGARRPCVAMNWEGKKRYTSGKRLSLFSAGGELPLA